jgi:hypothetical protein
MAKRPIFVPSPDIFPFVKQEVFDFEWHPGFAKVQAQKSIASLHESAAQKGITPVLEISSKSNEHLGISLSAFNLMLKIEGKEINEISVECAYQGSKVFEKGGAYTDLYSVSSRDAKTDERLKTSGNVTAFSLFGQNFPTQPITAFYDLLYIKALWQNRELAEKLLNFKGFSDIAFNPNKSINCQAHSAALFVSLHQNGKIKHVVEDEAYYINLITNKELKTSFKSLIGEQQELQY